ncbi:permease [Flagellimonas nanhaiensis]|uniref:Permease n=1 Tax=Flagellimonas nanhaiensis TaxID=2292706 RepID=A0A371JUN0_9FLAO|nr:permease [Allomuricauda nanhaiensis]RDY61486.1 permease [Allomuricauda nanhaiensis]
MFDWIQNLADWLVYELLNLNNGQHLAEALNFFIYDTVKILILLFVVIFFMGIVNSYFPIDRVKNYLSRNKLFGLEYLMASLFGIVTPFCSCSSVPLFIGFVRGGIPLGVTFSFLITSPLVNEVAIGLFVGLFGVKTTIIYVISGVLLGTISGIILQSLKLERYLTPWVKEVLANAQKEQDLFQMERKSFKQRLPIIWKEVIKILKGITPYVMVGIAIGGLMHGYIPEGFFERYMDKDNLFAVPLATILAIPMYSNASGVLPIVQVLVAKGIPLGTAIAFMMGVVGLSLPEALLLKKVMTLKLIAIFFSVVALCIIASGYLFNLIL